VVLGAAAERARARIEDTAFVRVVLLIAFRAFFVFVMLDEELP
jgi:hypothetical protein